MKSSSEFLTIRFLLFCALNITLAWACGGGGGGCKSCTWQTCSASWRSWTPWPSSGQCVYQWQHVVHNYATHSKSCGGCPGSQRCTQSSRSRVFCSCRVIAHCRWGAWGPFQGSIARGSCGAQRRYRNAEKTWTYQNRVGSCSGTVTRCPRETDSQQRTMCNCRKAARCLPTNWSAWSGNVQNGQCRTQSSFSDYVPEYQYIQQLTNCHGIQPNCPGRRTNARTYCRCHYLHCTEEDWTPWTVLQNGAVCPEEERSRRHKGTSMYKGAHNNCNGILPQSCPNPRTEKRTKPVTCPAVVSPHRGTLVGEACNGDKSACGSTCAVDCDRNFPLQGNRYITCQASGQWSGSLGMCKDSIKPTIICPSSQPKANVANKNYALVELPDVPCSDNSQTCTVTISHKSPVKVTVKTPIKVTFTATDPSGNSRSCWINLVAKDVEPPKVEFCPKDMIVQTFTKKATVIWKEPTFTDNVDASVSRSPNYQNGQEFAEGSYDIRYTAEDSSLNKVTCEFKVQVSRIKCPLYDPPKHGASACNVKKDGVEEVYICTAACKAKYWFLQGEGIPKQYDFYVCGEDGGWKGQNQFSMTNPGANAFLEPIPKGITPWPDCSEGDPPSEASKPFTVVGGSCAAADVATLKLNFVNAMTTDMFIQNLYCQNNKHCVVKNIKVYCSSVKKRSTGSSYNAVHISFEFYVQDTAPSTDQNTEIGKMTQIMNSMGGLAKEVKRIAATQLKTSAANVMLTEKAAQLACEDGYTFTVVNGSGTTKERSKCVKCPAGTMYKADTKSCQVCPVGTYQETEGQSICKKCPGQKSTHGFKAANHTACKEICPPGTYSADGLATCIACEKGSFQPNANSTSCVSCPSGKGTSKPGSVALTDCISLYPPQWSLGDGIGGTEVNVGVVKNKEECYSKCSVLKSSSGIANGCTVDAATGRNCYCEYGQTGRNTVSKWRNTYIKRGAVHVKIESQGCNDQNKPAGTCGVTKLEVNGVDKSKKQRGYNVVVVNEQTGIVESSTSYDTHGSSSAKTSMRNFINGLSNGKILLIGIQDEGASRAYNDVYLALESVYGQRPFQYQFRGSFAMIGYKGLKRPAWIRQVVLPSGRGPAKIEANIPLA